MTEAEFFSATNGDYSLNDIEARTIEISLFLNSHQKEFDLVGAINTLWLSRMLHINLVRDKDTKKILSAAFLSMGQPYFRERTQMTLDFIVGDKELGLKEFKLLAKQKKVDFVIYPEKIEQVDDNKTVLTYVEEKLS